ncbi:hypothetical protein CO058_00340, partial [candidate division WWE3 bacterium CG_4_9_14_0_2_um_filter_35_11]
MSSRKYICNDFLAVLFTFIVNNYVNSIFFVVAFVFFSIFFSNGVYAACTAYGCVETGDCDSGALPSTCESETAYCTSNCTKACENGTVDGVATVSGNSCNGCSYSISCGACDCGGGGGETPSDTTPPVCTDPTFSPSNKINGTSVTGTGTASDANGIAKTGVYIYQGGTHIKELQNNDTANTSTTLSKAWDLKNEAGSVVADGTYQMHFNWYDPSNNVQKCTQDFVIDKTSPVCGAWTFDPTSPSGADSISIVSTA